MRLARSSGWNGACFVRGHANVVGAGSGDADARGVLVALAGGVSLCVAGWAVQRVANPTATAPGYWRYLMLVPLR